MCVCIICCWLIARGSIAANQSLSLQRAVSILEHVPCLYVRSTQRPELFALDFGQQDKNKLLKQGGNLAKSRSYFEDIKRRITRLKIDQYIGTRVHLKANKQSGQTDCTWANQQKRGMISETQILPEGEEEASVSYSFPRLTAAAAASPKTRTGREGN